MNVSLITRSIQELGPVPVLRNGWYQFLLKSGIYRTIMPFHPLRDEVLHGDFQPLPMPEETALKPYLSSDSMRIFEQKEAISKGSYFPFGSKQLHRWN